MAVTTTYDTFPSTVAPQFDFATEDTQRSIISEMDSGLEERNNIWRFSKRAFTLAYRYLTQADRKTLHDFFRNQRGSWKPFWFKEFELRDWNDEFIGYGGPLDIGGAISQKGLVYTDELDHATDATHDDMTLIDFTVTTACKAQWNAAATSGDVDDTSAFSVDDGIIFELDNGTYHYSTVHSITDSDTLTIHDAIPGGRHVDVDADIILVPIYYFGHKAKFDKLTVTIHDQGAGTWTITWDYWNGTAWHAFAGGEYTDDTTGFTAAAGDRDFHITTMPVDWAIYEVEDQYLYWIRARITACTVITTAPTGTQAWVGSSYFDLHTHTTTSASLLVYIDGVAIAADAGTQHYHFISGGGAGGRDRISFATAPTVGQLITADAPGYLCVLSRLTNDSFKESVPFNDLFNVELGIQEVFE